MSNLLLRPLEKETEAAAEAEAVAISTGLCLPPGCRLPVHAIFIQCPVMKQQLDVLIAEVTMI